MKIRLHNLVSTMVLATALVVPTLLPADAAAQGRSDHGGRHDNGRHEGWKGNGKNDRDRDRRDDRGRNDRDRRDDRNRYDRRDDNRQTQKNNWRNLGIAGGAAGIYGLLTGNKTVAALGLGGGLYSTYRYEQDRKSQNRDSRGRYELFNRSSFDHQGHHYVRRERNQDGQKYYYFQRQR